MPHHLIYDTGKDLIRSNDSTQSLFLMDAVSSVMQSGVRNRRSVSRGDSLKAGVTVETAVFIDETLYDIMRKTFSGLFSIPFRCMIYRLFVCQSPVETTGGKTAALVAAFHSSIT